MRPADKVLAGRKSVKVAVVQTPPVYLGREATVSRACERIAEAARHGAELIAFTEPGSRAIPTGTKVGDRNCRTGLRCARNFMTPPW